MELDPVLHAQALRFRFPARSVFEGLSVSLPAGITWLRGANGKGKTTLLKLLGGALAPQAGTIRLHGMDSASDALAYRRNCHLAGGEIPALPWLTVRELLDVHMALFPETLAPHITQQLEAFDVLDSLDQPLTTLSLGQHKKVQLALALALPVRLLLLDEPFNGLDAAAMRYLHEQLGQRAGKACIILTSHVEPRLALAGTLDL
jgi:ABC-2 type transport system ATP-binding protein